MELPSGDVSVDCVSKRDVERGCGVLGVPVIHNIITFVRSVIRNCGTLSISTRGSNLTSRFRRGRGARGSGGGRGHLVNNVVIMTDILNMTLTIILFLLIPHCYMDNVR